MDALLESLATPTSALGFLLRATTVLVGASVLCWALRKRTADTRHLLWTATFVTLLALPLVTMADVQWKLPVLPTVAMPEVPGPATSTIAGTSAVDAEMRARVFEAFEPPEAGSSGAVRGDAASSGGWVGETQAAAARNPRPIAMARGVPLASLIWIVWAAGTAAALLSLLVGGFRLRGIVRRAQPLRDPNWLGQAAHVRRQLGIRRDVPLLTSTETATPLTGGWQRPVVLLPVSATSWSAERRDVVLAHELIHVRRHDALRQVVGRVALAPYWFHPLGWLASRLARSSREQACDETVLTLGTRPSDYAAHLLDLAADLNPAPPVLALPIVQRSQLERRIMAILRPDAIRATPASSAIVLFFMSALGASAATAHPVPMAQEAPPRPPRPEVAPEAAPSPASAPEPGWVLAGRDTWPEPPGVLAEPWPESMGVLAAPEAWPESMGTLAAPEAWPEPPAVPSALEAWPEPAGVLAPNAWPEPAPVWTTPGGWPEPPAALAPDGWPDTPAAMTAPERRPGTRGVISALEGWPDSAPMVSIHSQEATCRMEGQSGNFRGSLSTRGTRTEQSGWHNGDRTIQRYVDDLRLCMRVHGEVVMDDDGLAVRAVGSDSWVVLEAEEGELQRLVITEGPGGIEHTWSVDGRESAFGADERVWRDQMFTVLGAFWEASRLRGEQSSLQGEISSHRGNVSSLRGEISSYHGEVSSLQGEISSDQGHVSSLQGEISSYQGHVSSLRGEISSLRGEVSGLQADLRTVGSDEGRSRLAREILKTRH